MKRLGDETLRNFGPVRVVVVNEIDAEFDAAPQDGDRLGMIARLSPYARAGELHRAEAESANGNVATDQKCSARFSGASVSRARRWCRGFDRVGGVHDFRSLFCLSNHLSARSHAHGE